MCLDANVRTVSIIFTIISAMSRDNFINKMAASRVDDIPKEEEVCLFYLTFKMYTFDIMF